MATQTEIQLEPIIASPPRTYLKGHGIDAGPTPFNANEEISNVPPNPEQLELQDSDDHPEASTAYATPNVRAVKGKLFSIYFAVFIAGMNGMYWHYLRAHLVPVALTSIQMVLLAP